MRRSKSEVYLHMVWATKGRQPLLTPDIERPVHRCLIAEARRLGCDVLALDGVEDHVHIVVKPPTRLSPAELAHQLKGVSSHMVRGCFPEHDGFAWQEAYSVFSLSRPHIATVVRYVRDQKRHHASGKIWPQWEETGEAMPTMPDEAAHSPGGRSAEGHPAGSFKARDSEILYALLGDLPPRDRDVAAEVVRVEEHPLYTLEVLRLDLNGDEIVPAYFTRPRGVKGAGYPAVVYSHSHGGDYALGKDEFLRGRAYIAEPPWAEELAGMGVAGLCIDAWCFGERRRRTESETFKEMLWRGEVLWGRMVYDTLKATDYLVSRPDVDASRLVTMGMSMGSTMAWWHAALDERVKVCVDICCLTDFEALIAARGLDGHGLYYYVPGLLKHFSTADINALIAPRPHLALAGNLDPLTPPDGLDRIDAELRRAYAEDGALEQWKLGRYGVAHVETEAMRTEAAAWLRRWL